MTARKTSATPTRVYSYGVRPLTAITYVNDQLWLGRKHYNNLIELERTRRALFRTVRSAAVGDVDAMEIRREAAAEKLSLARQTLKQTSAAARKRTKATKEEREEISGLRAELDAAKVALKAARAAAAVLLEPAQEAWNARMQTLVAEYQAKRPAAKRTKAIGPRIKEKLNAKVLWEMLGESQWPEFWKWSAAIEGYATYRRKELRAASKLAPGTYLLVEKAVEAAAKSKVDPRFKRFEGEGRVGVQLRDATMQDIYGGRCPGFELDELPQTQWDTRSGRRHAYTRSRLRLALTDDGKPVTVDMKVVLSRPPPNDAIVKWVVLKVTKIAMRVRYELQLTLESKTFVKAPARTVSPRVVAIDLGWRAMSDGKTRIAYYHDDRNVDGELLLPEKLRDKLASCDKLRSYRMQHFNEARASLSTWMAAQPSLPEWLVEATRYLPQWHVPHKLDAVAVRLVRDYMDDDERMRFWRKWVAHRKGAGQDLFGSLAELSMAFNALRNGPARDDNENFMLYLHCWQRKNDHLHFWEESQREHVMDARQDLYRKWAHDMAQRYDVLIVEKFDLRPFARNAQPEENSAQDHQHRIRNDGAPSYARTALVNAAGKERVVKESAVDSTRECHLCHHINKTWEQPEKLLQTCAGCSATWDQDYNASRILLGRYYAGTAPEAAAAE